MTLGCGLAFPCHKNAAKRPITGVPRRIVIEMQRLSQYRLKVCKALHLIKRETDASNIVKEHTNPRWGS
jgi:hypothetical protein